MYDSRGSAEFRQQYITIEYYYIIADKDKSKNWFREQKELPYLPKSDIFAFYCPMCNDTLQFRNKCRCGQMIDWKDDMVKKIIE